jgi:hypothetical protein
MRIQTIGVMSLGILCCGLMAVQGCNNTPSAQRSNGSTSTKTQVPLQPAQSNISPVVEASPGNIPQGNVVPPIDSPILNTPPQNLGDFSQQLMSGGFEQLVEGCMKNDRASCEALNQKEAAMGRIPNMGGGDRIRLDVQKSNNAESWQRQHLEAKENERYYSQQGELDKAKYWKQRADEYKPPYNQR